MFSKIRLASVLITSMGCILFLQPQAAWACSCIRSTVEEQMERADIVFIGRVVGQKKKPLKASPVGELDLVQWTFEVETDQKGAVPNQVMIESATNSAACGINFQMGGRYQVFAHRSQNAYRASLCSGTKALTMEIPEKSFTPPPCQPMKNKQEKG